MNRAPETTGPLGEGGSEMYAALLQGEYGGDAALLASQQMLQILMDSMTNAVFWKDRQSRYLGCNKVFASFAGVAPEAMVGLSDRDMPWADDPDFDADWFVDWDRVVVESRRAEVRNHRTATKRGRRSSLDRDQQGSAA